MADRGTRRVHGASLLTAPFSARPTRPQFADPVLHKSIEFLPCDVPRVPAMQRLPLHALFPNPEGSEPIAIPSHFNPVKYNFSSHSNPSASADFNTRKSRAAVLY